jgi:hypothetical protein
MTRIRKLEDRATPRMIWLIAIILIAGAGILIGLAIVVWCGSYASTP